jgi:hypothetical protein
MSNLLPFYSRITTECMKIGSWARLLELSLTGLPVTMAWCHPTSESTEPL